MDIYHKAKTNQIILQMASKKFVFELCAISRKKIEEQKKTYIYPNPAPTKNETRLVMSTVNKTSFLEKKLFFLMTLLIFVEDSLLLG